MPDFTATEIVFWAVVALMLYTLKGYPVLLSLFSSMRKMPVYEESSERPVISIIVAAYNEEKNIAAKLGNLKEIEYDAGRIEFIIGSDASTDGTDRILTEAADGDERIRYFRLDVRGGKIAVLHRAVEMARGSILVFTDCSVRTDPDFVPIVLSSFGDEKVGLVSSRDVWVDEAEGSPVTQYQYIDYEMKIRRMESRLNSLVSVSGSFFAVRRELFQTYDSNLADDFALPLKVYRQGYRVIHRDDLVGYVPMVKSSEAEFNRRTRIVQAGIRTVGANLSLLNPLRYPVFAWQLWSHKVLKWFFPFMTIACLVLIGMLWDHGLFYKVVGVGCVVMIFAAFMGIANNVPRLGKTAGFLLLSMGAVLTAWFKIITGAKAKTWEPTHR